VASAINDAKHVIWFLIWVKPGAKPRTKPESLIRAKLETKLCLRQIFDSWNQNFAEQVSRWPKASSKANQSPDDGHFATMSSSQSSDVVA
jgi:hypothetical protein